MKGSSNRAAQGHGPNSAFESEAGRPHQAVVSTELAEGVAHIALDGVHNLTLLVFGDGGFGEPMLVNRIKSVRLTQRLARFPARLGASFPQRGARAFSDFSRTSPDAL